MTDYINKEYYKQLRNSDRHFIKLSQEAAYLFFDKLKAEGIPYSAIVSEYRCTATVDKKFRERSETLALEAEASIQRGRTIIGNTEYKNIRDKKYIETDAETANQIAHILAGNGSNRFSGVIHSNGKATITVSGERNAAAVRTMIENLKNMDLLSELHEAGYERVSGNNGFVNIRNNRTGEIRGFNNLEAVRDMFNNTDNEFFHPLSYRVEYDGINDNYFISQYSTENEAIKSVYHDNSGNAATFNDVDEATAYANRNRLKIANLDEEINNWREFDIVREDNSMSAENKKLIADFPMSDGAYPDIITFDESNSTFNWLYFNPNGDNGNGEFVEKKITLDDIYEAYIARISAETEAEGRNAFIAVLNSCAEEKINTYTARFEEYADTYVNYKSHGATEFYGICENSKTTYSADSLISLLEHNCPAVETDKEQRRQPTEINGESDNIEVNGYFGTWYVIDTDTINGQEMFLLESEIYGDEAACLIVDKNANLIMSEVWNGFDDYIKKTESTAVMSTPAALQTIEIENYTEPDENRRVKHIGNKTFGEVFETLENHLKDVGLLPSDYFSLNEKIADTEIPENWKEFICNTNFGGSEGIYLDIGLVTSDNKHINFATGKTLDEDVEAFVNMSRIGAECSMMLNGNGAKIRHRQVKSAEKNIEAENVIDKPQPNEEQPQESNTFVTQLAAIESTEDYQENRFNADLIDTDTKGADGTYGKVQEKYRIVTVQSNILAAYNNEVYNSFEEAEKALDNISGLKKVSYDEIVNYVGLERAKETMSYEQNDVKSSELENNSNAAINDKSVSSAYKKAPYQPGEPITLTFDTKKDVTTVYDTARKVNNENAVVAKISKSGKISNFDRANLNITDISRILAFAGVKEMDYKRQRERDNLNVNAPKKIPNTIPHRIFKGLSERFPEIMNKTHSHEHYESTGFEPLSVEWIGGNSISLMQYYTQYGDIMRDPDIVLNIDFENETANAVSYENSGLGIYNEYDIGSAMQKDCNSFMLDWINQLEHMHHHITRATVEHKYNGDTYDIDLNFNDGKVISVDGDEAAAADYIQNNNIEIYLPAPMTEIGKPNDFQIGDIILYEGRPWTIDNLDFDDNEMIYITANDNSGDERAFYHGEIVSLLEKGGFHFTDNQEELKQDNNIPSNEKPIALNVGDYISYKGKTWEITRSDTVAVFKNFDENDPEQEFSYEGGIDKFINAEDGYFSIISEAEINSRREAEAFTKQLDEQGGENMPDSIVFSFGNEGRSWFSESGELHSFWAENNKISFALGNAILEYLDKKQHIERENDELNVGWYHKTDFGVYCVVDGENFNYEGRYDIGDGAGTGGGTLVEHIRDFTEYRITKNPFHESDDEIAYAQHTLDVLIPFLEKHSVLSAEEQQIMDKFKKDNPIKGIDIEQSEKTDYDNIGNTDVPDTLNVGDFISYSGKTWEVTRNDFIVDFKNIDETDPEREFSHIGGVNNFIKAHMGEFRIIPQNELNEPNKANNPALADDKAYTFSEIRFETGEVYLVPGIVSDDNISETKAYKEIFERYADKDNIDNLDEKIRVSIDNYRYGSGDEVIPNDDEMKYIDSNYIDVMNNSEQVGTTEFFVHLWKSIEDILDDLDNKAADQHRISPKATDKYEEYTYLFPADYTSEYPDYNGTVAELKIGGEWLDTEEAVKNMNAQDNTDTAQIEALRVRTVSFDGIVRSEEVTPEVYHIMLERTLGNRDKLAEAAELFQKYRGNIMPVYPKTIKEANEAGERELYFSDREENEMCKRSIDYAVTCNYVDMRFKSENVMLELLSRYSAERIANLIAARVIDAGKWDKRYSQKNIEWANDFLSDYSADDLEKKFHSYLNAHPILLNDIADSLRENLDKYIEKQQSQGNENTYSIYQVKKGIDYLSKRFVSYDELPDQPNIADYDLVYQGSLNDFGRNKLDEIFRKFNIDIPADYKGHSLSVSDVIILNGNEAHFVDSVGFKDIPDFFVERNERTQPVNNAAFNSEQESKYKEIKNLAQLKRALTVGAEFEITSAIKNDVVNQFRRVNYADTTAIYSIRPDAPDDKNTTLANNGRGSYLPWNKSADWEFNGVNCTAYRKGQTHTKENMIFTIKVNSHTRDLSPVETQNEAEKFRAKTNELFKNIDGKTAAEIESEVKDYILETLRYAEVEADIKDVIITGSRSRGFENAYSDIDVVLEYDGEMKEDSLFNILNDGEYKICGITVDINPIRTEETGTLESYLPNAEMYLAAKAEKVRAQRSDPAFSEAVRLINKYSENEFGEKPSYSKTEHIDLAYHTDRDTNTPVDVYADLDTFRIVKEYGGKIVSEDKFTSLAEMNKFLANLDFDDLVSLTDVQKGIEAPNADNQTKAANSDEPTQEENKSPLGTYEPHINDIISFEGTDYSIADINGSYLKLREINTLLPQERTVSVENLLNGDYSLLEKSSEENIFNVRAASISNYEGTDALYGEDKPKTIAPKSGKVEKIQLYNEPKPYQIITYNSNSGSDEKPEYATLEEAVEEAKKYLQDGYYGDGIPGDEGFAVYNINTKKIERVGGYFPAERVFTVDVLKENGFFGNLQNFVITDDKHGEIKGEKARYAANIEAIKVLKKIEAEHRIATPEEQKILSKYTGWGAVWRAFDESKENWSKEFDELKETLTPNEYSAARRSTMNAFYTSPTVISAIYEGLNNLGFKSGNILEPAMGTGNFFGKLPENMSESNLYGVELDSISGRIAQQLYPNADIQIMGFEHTDFPDNSFDVAIGNVPFGEYKVNDKSYNDKNFFIHDYFVSKALDKVHPGGIVAVVTSAGTLDKNSDKVRQHLAQRAELLGAIRLPAGTFKANAGTDAAADILFLQKRDKAIEINKDKIEWINKSKTADGISVNSYFVNHPEMVLGKIVKGNKLNENEASCIPIEGADLKKQLSEAIKNIKGSYRKSIRRNSVKDSEVIPAPANSRKFSYYTENGELYFREADTTMKKVNVSKDLLNRAIGLIELRDNVHELLNMQINNGDKSLDNDIAESRAKLNKRYDSFVKKYGNINSKKNAKAMKGDKGYSVVCALETKDKKTNEVIGKADIFTKDTVTPKSIVTHVDTAEEALILSVSEKAKVDFEYMTQLCGMDKDSLITALDGQIFKLPQEQEKYVTADEYLSENIRKKIAELKNAPDDYDYSKNRKALEAAIPPLVEAKDISVNLGAAWIDPKYIKDFIIEILKPEYRTQSEMDVQYSKAAGAWKIAGLTSLAKSGYEATQKYGTGRKNAYDIIEGMLNNSSLLVKDRKKDKYGNEIRDEKGNYVLITNEAETRAVRHKANAIKAEFRDWIFKDPDRREELVKKYNELYNSVRLREYDGSHLSFAGMNPNITLKEHQKNVIARALYGGNTLIAHATGAGKTYAMGAIAMEGKRIGLHHKSLIAVPNGLTEQIGSEIQDLYPNAKILIATKEDFEKKNRAQFISNIATNDWDIVVVGHTQFDRMALSPERERKYLLEEVNKLRQELRLAIIANEGKKSFTVKKVEKTIASYEAKLQKLNDKQVKDDFIDFEQLGFDKMFVDEAHNYKNLETATKMHNVAGLGSRGSARAFNLLMKTKYLDEVTDSKGTVLSTATPVSNSMVELYTFQRYLQADLLKEMGFNHFDEWASVFGEVTTDYELKPESDGKYQLKTRFSKFTNLPELMAMFKQSADIRTADTLDLDKPNVVVENIVADPSAIQKVQIKALAERAKEIRCGGVDPRIDNMLCITTDGRKIGLDQRLIDPSFPDNPDSKVNICINKVFDIYQETAKQHSTQCIFCDLSTPKSESRQDVFMVYRPDAEKDKEYDIIRKKVGIKNNMDFALIKKHISETAQEDEDKLHNGDVVVIRRPNEDMTKIISEAALYHNGKFITDKSVDLLEMLDFSPIEDMPPKEFNIYDDIKKKLAVMGVPEKDIAFIHDYDTAEDKQKLFNQMNAGEVRILLGSTGKCGEGMNAQRKMAAIHHLDAPLRPKDMVQRDGRGDRPGNENDTIRIFHYVTERTFDAYLYQMLETKQRSISQIMTSKTPERVCADIDEEALDYAQVKALCAGNPLIKEEMELQAAIRDLKMEKSRYTEIIYNMQDKIRVKYPNEIELLNMHIKHAKADYDKANAAEKVKDSSGSEVYPIKIDGVVYTDREEGGNAIKTALGANLSTLAEGHTVNIGEYRGMKLSVFYDTLKKCTKACLEDEKPHYCDLNARSVASNLTKLDNCIENIKLDIEITQEKADKLTAELNQMRIDVEAPFPKNSELLKLENRLDVVREELTKFESQGDKHEKDLFNQLCGDFFPVISGQKDRLQYKCSNPKNNFSVEMNGNIFTITQPTAKIGIQLYINFEDEKAEALSFINGKTGEKFFFDPEKTKATAEIIQKKNKVIEFADSWLKDVKTSGFTEAKDNKIDNISKAMSL